MRRAPWLVLVLAAACSEAQSYVYSARRYDPNAKCLDRYVSIDLVDGTGTGNECGPTCFRFNKEIYTTRVCPPLPAAVEELAQDSGECIAANEPSIYDASCAALEPGAGGDGGDDDADAGDAGDAAVLDAPSEGG